jgi:hypothetical protein
MKNIIRKYNFLLLILFSLLLSCSDDEMIIPQENVQIGVIDEECTSYFTSNIGFASASIITNYKDFIVLGGTNEIKVLNASSMTLISRYTETQLQANNFTILENELLICSIKGIFSVNSEGIIAKVSSSACGSMIFYENKLLYVSSVGTLSSNQRAASTVKLLDRNTYEHTFYTDSNYVSTNQFPRQIIEFQDNLFLLSSLDNEVNIIKLVNNQVDEIYSSVNDPGLGNIDIWFPPSNTKLFTWRDKLWFFTDGEFSIVRKWNIENTDLRSIDRMFASSNTNEISFLEDNLCISTSEGLFILDNDSDIEISLLRDPLLPSNNWVSFISQFNSIDYVLTNHEFLTKVECR